jgi:hypothetical protein
MKKIHFCTKDIDMACNTKIAFTVGDTTEDPEKVTCLSCKRTLKFIEARDKKEREREVGKDEFSEPQKEWAIEIKGNTQKHMGLKDVLVKNEIKYTINKEKTIKEVYFIEYVFINKEHFDFFVYYYNNYQKDTKPKPQTDKEKYNLSDEQWEILSKVDYEAVRLSPPYKDGYKCDWGNCIFRTQREVCPIDCYQSGKHFIFKQIHKPKTSLNESIEKETVLNEGGVPLLEDFTVNINREPNKIYVIKNAINGAYNFISDYYTRNQNDIFRISFGIQTKEIEITYRNDEKVEHDLMAFIDNVVLNKPSESNVCGDKPTILLTGKEAVEYIESKNDNSCEEDNYADTPDKYKFTMINRNGESIVYDVYDLLKSIKAINPAIQHAIKKVINPGGRGSKDFTQDITEAIQSLEIAKLL